MLVSLQLLVWWLFLLQMNESDQSLNETALREFCGLQSRTSVARCVSPNEAEEERRSWEDVTRENGEFAADCQEIKAATSRDQSPFPTPGWRSLNEARNTEVL